jgi:hypothetical protein
MVKEVRFFLVVENQNASHLYVTTKAFPVVHVLQKWGGLQIKEMIQSVPYLNKITFLRSYVFGALLLTNAA